MGLLARRIRGALGIGVTWGAKWVVLRRRTLHQLSLWRVALWGLLGGVAIPLLMGTDGSMGWISGPMGAAFAAASVAAARRRALPEAEPRGLLE